MATPKLTLGAKLLRDALARYPSQQELAAALGATQQSVSGWITEGGPVPRLKTLMRIKAVLGIEPDAFTVPHRGGVRRPSKRRRSGVTRAVGAATGTEG